MAEEDCASPFRPLPESVFERFNPPDLGIDPDTARTVRAASRPALDATLNPEQAAADRTAVEKLRNQRSGQVPLGFWSRYGQPFSHVFDKVEAALPDVPIHSWYRQIESARTRVATHVDPYIDEVRAIAGRIPRIVRSTDMDATEGMSLVERLFEGRMMRDSNQHTLVTSDTVRKMEAKLHPDIIKAADALEDVYRRFFKDMGYSRGDIREFFSSFPALRERGGVAEDLVDSTRRVRVENMPDRIPTRLGRDDANTVQGKLQTFKLSQMQKSGRIGSDMYQDFRNGDVLIDGREYNFAIIAQVLMRKQGEAKYLAPTWNNARSSLKSLADEGLIPSDVYSMWMRYTSSVRHIPDEVQVSIARSFAKIDAQVFKKTGGLVGTGKNVGKQGGVGSKEYLDPYLDIAGRFLSVNYLANMGLNPGVALRNYWQPFLTSFPIIQQDLAYGLKMAMSSNKKIMWQGEMKSVREISEDIGIISRSNTPEQVRQQQTAMSALGAEGPALTNFGKAWEMYQTSAWSMFRAAETHTRMSAYWGMRQRALRTAGAYMKSDRSAAARQAFLDDSSLGLMTPDNSSYMRQIFEWMDDPKAADKAIDRVAHSMGKEHTSQSMFIYTAGNAPGALQTSVGRFFGQYGTWPAWFAAQVGRTARYGSRKARIKAIGAGVAMNTALGVGVAEVFGTDVSAWIYLSPLNYEGGPFLQGGGDIMAAAKVGAGKLGILGEETDPVQLIRASRAPQMLNQLAPVPRQFGNVANWGGTADHSFPGGKLWEDIERFEKEGFAEAARRGLGFRKYEGDTLFDKAVEALSPNEPTRRSRFRR
tara:strand:- start:5196 stop:7643 length:2448 start_codon:yes stop_codon:yes gene_type:complete